MESLGRAFVRWVAERVFSFKPSAIAGLLMALLSLAMFALTVRFFWPLLGY